ncbi:hypothetical protein [Streptomyces sp. NPDC047000]|uniref:hypothetical protein n=1 Tax=Streptomyces sp. NPDC047000 TaxID=3155474 RepID=UPI0034074DBD
MAPVAPARRSGRRRTTLLIAGAAALGIVAGTCTGYVVQAGRAPTELPSLSQPALAQAKGPAPEPLSAAQDRQVKTGGDLRKLLLQRPKGARDAAFSVDGGGWLDAGEYADTYTKPASAFENLVIDEFRRAVETDWQVGSTYTVEIQLVQFRQEEKAAASDWASGQAYWAGKQPDTDSWPVKGTGDGMAYVHHAPEHRSGYVDGYSAEAVAWRGDLVMEIWITDTRQIPKKDIVDLAERQMERL